MTIRRLAGQGALIGLVVSFASNASGILVTTATDKPYYLPQEPITVLVTADNNSPSPLTLYFTSSLQSSYVMDGVYDWTMGKVFLTVLTEVTIQPFSSYTWDLDHDWQWYAPAVGTHWVVGYVVGSVQWSPVEFAIVPAQLGDANSDLIVDVQDLSILATNWNETGMPPWDHGNFNGDDVINVQDLAILATNWGWDGTGGAVPEPATLAVLALSGLALLGKRRP